LLWASENGNIQEVKKLLDKAQLQDLIADINHRGLDNWTPLHFAANEGHIEVVKELLSHPDIEREPISSINRTPLHLAAMRGHTNIVRMLIECKAKPEVDRNYKDFDMNTPLHYASEYGHFECIIYLVKEALADASIKNKFGYTPSDIAQNMRIR
jgi:ankyrin repeat protein